MADPKPRTARRAWRGLELITLVTFDALAVASGLAFANWVFQQTANESAAYPSPAEISLQVLVMLAVFFFLQLYHQDQDVSRFELSGRVFRAVTIGMILAFVLTTFAFQERSQPPRLFVYTWLATLFFVLLLRLLHRALHGLLLRAGIGRSRVLVVGAGPAGQDLVSRIHRSRWRGYEVVGLLDDTPGRTRARGVPVIGHTAEIEEAVHSKDIDEVFIALPGASRAELLELVSRCDRPGTTVRLLPDVFEMMAGEVRISDLEGLPLVTMRDVTLSGWRRTLKRGFDVVLSGLAIVLLSPLILLLALLVKLESRGPAFYAQERMGLDMRPFPILKLRSMRTDAEADTGAVWARRDDPRVTRLGRFMRKTNLDELPQLINVLLGQMSIVGPRPERPEFVAEFRRDIPRYAERHRERGGITGWAQVNGLRGDTSIEERTKYDLYYIENWSILFDLEIILRTVVNSFRDPNAY